MPDEVFPTTSAVSNEEVSPSDGSVPPNRGGASPEERRSQMGGAGKNGTDARSNRAERDRVEESAPAYRRRVIRPIVLFLLTCVTTFLAGASGFPPWEWPLMSGVGGDGFELRRVILDGWPDGLLYMTALIGILFAHEMGHFLMTVWYGIPASFPYFIPVPNLTGTMGAVIRMDGMRADRRQIFDIGIAGPLAGLVIAIPVMIAGVLRIDLSTPGHHLMALDCPLIVRLFFEWLRPELTNFRGQVLIDQADPLFMAGWTGMLVTGMNMFPMGQLDGGHVMYALLKRNAKFVAFGILFVAIAVIIYFGLVKGLVMPWFLMLILVTVTGVAHPPTRDDNVTLGWIRTGLGIVSLTIPIFCFPFWMVYMLDVAAH